MKLISFSVRTFLARKVCSSNPTWSGTVDLVRLFAHDLMPGNDGLLERRKVAFSDMEVRVANSTCQDFQ